MGRALSGGGEVDERIWQDFLDREVTPRFPDGLTVHDAYGQWRTPDGRAVRERTKVITIVLPATPLAARSLGEIADIYRAQFRQQSVGIVTSPSCAAG